MGLGGCGDPSPKTMTMVLTQPAPVLHSEFFGHETGAIGNLNSFGADLSENGQLVGELTGERVLTQAASEVAWAIEERVPNADGMDLTKFSVWYQTMSFHLEGRGSIQVQGDRLLVTEPNTSLIPAMVVAAQQSWPSSAERESSCSPGVKLSRCATTMAVTRRP